MLRRYKKGIAVLLLVTFMQEIFAPTISLALTGGPSQPEVQSFEPVGTNQMVDLSTGDFNYNIPLMVVPGPNGGYPINIAYHAGIGMEQEASWVGLGWNINPGAITRNLRGIPDDFSGDPIKKTVSLKKDVTVGIGVNTAMFSSNETYEIFGVPDGNNLGNLQLYYNNYRGIGYNISLRPKPNEERKVCDKDNGGIIGKIGVSFNSQSGLNLTYNKGIGAHILKNDKKWNVGVGIHSRQGLQSITFRKSRSHDHIENKSNGSSLVSKASHTKSGISFINHTHVPAQNNSMNGTNVNLGFTYAKKEYWPDFKKDYKVDASVSVYKIKNKQRTLNAYGTIYLQDKPNLTNNEIDYNQVMDVNVYNDVPISKNSVNMGVPIMTSDVYSITGQGVGGTFRAHRTDIGTVYKSGNISQTDNVSGAFELGIGNFFGTLLHVGVDVGYGYNNSYSGKWTGGMAQLSALGFRDFDENYPLYEPYYFKVAGEQVAIQKNEWSNMQGENPMAFEMALKTEDGSPRPMVKNNMPNSSKTVKSKSRSSERIKRVENIGHRTQHEIVNDEFYASRPAHIYLENQMPNNINGQVIDYGNIGSNHHLQAYDILRPDGATYSYGLPAYNTVQKEILFANTAADANQAYTDLESITYDPTDASVDNNQGNDKYFSETEIPGYAHANLITQITSADYVDLTNNGPSEDDFGFYTKFNYAKVNNYKWREPFKNANYIKGYYSNQIDDKASYTYGEKELYYSHSIETKTHVALFTLGDRNDGLGVDTIDQNDSSALGEKQKYLKKITLYSKADPNYGTTNATPLQTVHFEYNYELCTGVPNNDAGIDDADHIQGNTGGKLTLKKMYITYNGNEKGRLSPYQFNYGNNPNYSKLNMDRWGNYQTSATPNEFAQNPYTRQDLTISESNDNASAWCMNQMILPSGAEFNIEYEADDYGYVQDKRAMEMFEIVGFTKTDVNTLPTETDKMVKMTKKNRRLWFKLNTPLNGNSSEMLNQVADRISGIKEVYFKTFQELKRNVPDLNMAKDYVDGYAKIDPASYGYDNSQSNYAYVDLKEVTYQTAGLSILKTHPFRKAGWQYVRYERPDLFYNQNDAGNAASNFANNLLGIFVSLGTAVSDAIGVLSLGYYNKAAILGYNKKLSLNKRSFIRLNSPNKEKTGGGHRVKTVKLFDNWIEGAREFGTSYEYENANGFTSGVADYEPLIGGEENPLKNPIWYNGNDQTLSFKHIDAYVETPLMEAVYPGARVVYGRVVQKNIEDFNGNVSEAQSGILVHEFFTAKDFPVIENETALETKGYNIPIPIPFVGLQTFQNNGHSQGYSVVLNDMSGKPKSNGTYAYNGGVVTGLPVSKTEYIYRANNGKLNNTVTVLDAHGEQRKAILGVEQDFVVNEEQNNSVSFDIDEEFNLDLWLVQVPSFPVIPMIGLGFNGSVNYSESMYRGISTSKVIYKTGILESVKVYSEGSTVTTKNLMYDAETGEALLTKVENEWDKPVYNYAYPAHWAYDGMKPAYQNYHARLKIDGSAGALKLLKYGILGLQYIDPSTVLTLGDEISIFDATSNEYNTYYVTNIDGANDEFALENANGISIAFTNAIGKVTRSGKRNLQSVKNGSITALNTSFLQTGSNNNPNLSLFANSWNQYITGTSAPEQHNQTHFSTIPNVPTAQNNPQGNYYIPDAYYCNTNNEPRYIVTSMPGNSTEHFAVYTTAGACTSMKVLHFTGTGNQLPSTLGYIYTVPITNVSNTISSIYQLSDFEIISETVVSTSLSQLVLKYLPTGELFNAQIFDEIGHCEDIPCPPFVSGVLHAEAATFKDLWNNHPYADLGNPTNGTLPIADPSLNEYRYGKKGIWRTDKSYLYQEERVQSGTTANFNTQIDKDGEYNAFQPFSWLSAAPNANWDWVSEITMYSPYGFALEEKSRLANDPANGNGIDIYSSQMYGYDNSLVVAKSGNASYFEFGFNGFEEDSIYTDRGHLQLSGTSLQHTTGKWHTGKQSLTVGDAQSVSFNIDTNSSNQQLMGVNGKDYIVSLWVNVEDTNAKGTLTIGGTTVNTDDHGEIIDGWKKLELKFTKGASAQTITYTSTNDTYIDDLRIGPNNGGMVTYVYDRYNLWLTAELDALNYATFYNYDTEGNLVQVKKETEKGIVTVKTSRSNTKQLP